MEYLDPVKEKEEKKKKNSFREDGVVVNETLDDVMNNIERDNPKMARFRKKKGAKEEEKTETETETETGKEKEKEKEKGKEKGKEKEKETEEVQSEEKKGKEKEKGKGKETEKEKGKKENTNGEVLDEKKNATGDGGGVKEDAKGEIETAVVDTSNSDAYIKSLANNKPSSFVKEISENAGNSLNEARLKEKEELKKSLPELEQPTGLENKVQEGKEKTEPEEGKANNLDNAKLNPDQKKKEENTTHIVPTNQVIQIPTPQVSKDDPNAKSKVLNAISNISTSDNAVDTSPGDPPVVELNGLADPNQNVEQKNQADLDVQENKLKSDQQSMEDHGQNDIYPDVEKEILKVKQEINPAEEYSSSSGEQVPQVSQEVIQSFDEQSNALIQEKLQVEITKSDNKKLEMEQQSEEERKNSEEKMAEETALTTEKQKQEQNKAKDEVNQQQENWKQENQKLNDEYNTEANAEHENVSSQIETETANANAEAENQFAQAEQDAKNEKQRAEEEAERKKKEAENKEPSFWDKLADAVGDFFAKLKEGLNALFNALRKAVKFIIEKAKKAVTWLIDKARNAVIAFIKTFASFLKKLVSVVLAKFPALAKKINALIDKAVEVACEIVNALADALKKTICFLLDALGSALDFILAAYQKFYNMILDVLEFLTVGLIKIMKGIANLVMSAGQSPGHFLGQVSEELLGQDITKPLPNERPAPEAVSTEQTKEAVEEGEMEQKDANVLNKKKYSPDDFKVEPVPHDMELGAELLTQLMSMGESGTMEFGANSEPENDIEAVKDASINGTDKESASEEKETSETETPQPETATKEGGEATADSEMVGPFSSAAERGMYVVGKMIDGIKDFWNKNKVTIIAALVAVIVGVILANLLTGGAVMAALPILFQVASVYFAAETMYNVMKYFGSYLGDAWPGQLMKGAVSLARAFAIGAIELVMALLFGGKAFLKGAKNVAKTARKGGVKGMTKMAKNAAKKEARQMMRNGKKLAVIGRRGGRNAVKNGKMLYKGMGKGFAKGSKSFDDLGKKLGKQFRFRKFRVRVQKWRFYLEGEVNPWVLLASGEVKHVDQSELTRRKAGKLGDSVIYKPKGAAKGQKAIVIGEKRIGGKGSTYVERLRGDKTAGADAFNDLLAAENNAARKKLIKGNTGKTFEELEKLYGNKIASTINDRHKISANMSSTKPKALAGYDDLNAHHRIPVEAVEQSQILRDAIKEGFDFNGLVNGSWVRRYSSVNRVNPKTGKIIASPEGIHASHDLFNAKVIQKLDELEKIGYRPGEAKIIMEEFATDIGKKIDDLMLQNEILLKEGKPIKKINDLDI